MKKLYPLKFISIPKERVWGGKDNIGENWEISGFKKESTKVAEGFLEKNSLFDLVETYNADLVGEDHYKRYGNEFPLLIKKLFVDGRLSVQVHPDDLTAFDRHNSYGKNEAWYILDTKPDAKIYMGFNRDMDPNDFYKRCKEGKVEEVLNVIHPQKGDFFFIEAGTIHAAGDGVTIAEVQQLSDITYRVYDWGREYNPETKREMNLELAYDCINYMKYNAEKYFVPSNAPGHSEGYNRVVHLCRNDYFTMAFTQLSDSFHVYPENYNSFILYFSIDGDIKFSSKGNETILKPGEWVMIPASMDDFFIAPVKKGGIVKLLETYIEKPKYEKDEYININADPKIH
ncbi:MAG: type I phosphomannose isomerase catalytic subunit [Bacteroidales bacterium]